MFLQIEIVFHKVRAKSQMTKWHIHKQWWYKCCNSVNLISNSKLMTDRKHINHRKWKTSFLKLKVENADFDGPVLKK